MDQKKLGGKLRVRRESLGYSQLFLGVKIGVDQSTVSLLEHGELKFADGMIKKIKTVKGFEDFDQDPLQEEVPVAGPQALVMKWPFSKNFFYILVAGLTLFLFGEAFKAAGEISAGFSKGAGPDAKVHIGLILVFFSVIAFLIYWFFWKKKW